MIAVMKGGPEVLTASIFRKVSELENLSSCFAASVTNLLMRSKGVGPNSKCSTT